MALICLITTLIAILPTCLLLFRNARKTNFLFSLLNCSLGFFLFSFQVHEKSILLCALAALILIPMEPVVMLWFLEISTFSMFPLLVKDGLTSAFFATTIMFYFLGKISFSQGRHQHPFWKYAIMLSRFGSIALCTLHLVAPTLPKMPHLYPLMISMYSFVHLFFFFLYFNYKLFVISERKGWITKKVT